MSDDDSDRWWWLCVMMLVTDGGGGCGSDDDSVEVSFLTFKAQDILCTILPHLYVLQNNLPLLHYGCCQTYCPYIARGHCEKQVVSSEVARNAKRAKSKFCPLALHFNMHLLMVCTCCSIRAWP